MAHGTRSNRIQPVLNRKDQMKKLIFAVIVLSIGYFTIAKADQKTYTPQEFVESVASVPGKVGDHITNEWEDIKAYQAKSWADSKAQLQRLFQKFSKKED